MPEKEEVKEVKIRGVRKVGKLRIALIVVGAITAAGMLFMILNNLFGWVEILPW